MRPLPGPAAHFHTMHTAPPFLPTPPPILATWHEHCTTCLWDGESPLAHGKARVVSPGVLGGGQAAGWGSGDPIPQSEQIGAAAKRGVLWQSHLSLFGRAWGAISIWHSLTSPRKKGGEGPRCAGPCARSVRGRGERRKRAREQSPHPFRPASLRPSTQAGTGGSPPRPVLVSTWGWPALRALHPPSRS